MVCAPLNGADPPSFAASTASAPPAFAAIGTASARCHVRKLYESFSSGAVTAVAAKPVACEMEPG